MTKCKEVKAESKYKATTFLLQTRIVSVQMCDEKVKDWVSHQPGDRNVSFKWRHNETYRQISLITGHWITFQLSAILWLIASHTHTDPSLPCSDAYPPHLPPPNPHVDVFFRLGVQRLSCPPACVSAQVISSQDLWWQSVWTLGSVRG